MLVYLVAAMALGSGLSDGQAIGDVRPDRMDDLLTGSCKADQMLDISKVIFLQDKTLILGGSGGSRIGLDSDEVTIEDLRPQGSHSTAVIPVRYLITDGARLDITLRFGVFEGQLVVYWRETWQNRMYRQGLLAIAGNELRSICEGQGGVTYG